MIFFNSQLFVVLMSGSVVFGFLLALCTASTCQKSPWRQAISTILTTLAIIFAWVSTFLRWKENQTLNYASSPFSNLYEVLILFTWLMCFFSLWIKAKLKSESLHAILLIAPTSCAIYLIVLSALYQIQLLSPLPPSLQSIWMQLHVPANFLAYGFFSLAALTSFAKIIKNRYIKNSNNFIQSLPSLNVLDKVVFTSITSGFLFFTIAIVLGSLWANQAWGAYWSWDPKETWALIVWLNYAAWLHYAKTKPRKTTLLSWWAFLGFWLTLFAFLGVNFYLSGLHSYGRL